MWVRSPAGCPASSRSRPTTPPSAPASSSRKTSSPVEGKWMAASTSSGFLQRRPRQQQPLLPHAGEADQRLGLVAAARDLQHDALAPLAVDDVVARRQPQCLGAGGAYGRRRPPAHGGLDDAL